MGQFNFEASGKLKKPTSEELIKLDENNAILAYTSGSMPDGRSFYAYVAVIPSKYFSFMEATAKRTEMVLEEFGEVLEAGFEPSPADDVRQYMREKFGFDEEYERKLMFDLAQEQSNFVKQQQENRIADGLAILLKKKQEEK